MDIEVRVAGRGIVRGDQAQVDAATKAMCSLCGTESDVVSAMNAQDGSASLFACPNCLRVRLDAMSVARYRMREGGSGLPWGKVAG
jgi:hypothetical protein